MNFWSYFIKVRVFISKFLLPMRFRKAGRMWCGGARETHWATYHKRVTPSKTKEFLKSSCFLDLNSRRSLEVILPYKQYFLHIKLHNFRWCIYDNENFEKSIPVPIQIGKFRKINPNPKFWDWDWDPMG